MTSVYAQRRARLAAQLGDGGVAIIPTAPELHRNRDTEYLYRHDSYFYYLTGFSEPNACLVLTSDGRSVLFCQPKDIEREVWTGIRLGPDAALSKLGVDKAYSSDEINTRLPRLLEELGLAHGDGGDRRGARDGHGLDGQRRGQRCPVLRAGVRVRTQVVHLVDLRGDAPPRPRQEAVLGQLKGQLAPPGRSGSDARRRGAPRASARRRCG